MSKNFNFCKYKEIALGAQLVKEWTLLEYKPLFSLKLFNFVKSNGKQDRFHTHGFKAFSFLLKGNYIEEILKKGRILQFKRNRKKILYIPDNSYHRITYSDGCWTVLLTGSWGPFFTELRDKGTHWEEYRCACGRRDVAFLGKGDLTTFR